MRPCLLLLLPCLFLLCRRPPAQHQRAAPCSSAQHPTHSDHAAVPRLLSSPCSVTRCQSPAPWLKTSPRSMKLLDLQSSLSRAVCPCLPLLVSPSPGSHSRLTQASSSCRSASSRPGMLPSPHPSSSDSGCTASPPPPSVTTACSPVSRIKCMRFRPCLPSPTASLVQGQFTLPGQLLRLSTASCRPRCPISLWSRLLRCSSRIALYCH